MGQSDLRICFVGDSFVNGTGDPECLGWAGRLCAAARRAGHDLTYYNLGVRRETSADIRARWEREVRSRLPEGADNRVVFSFGANDATLEEGRPRVTADRSIEHARAMLTSARTSYPVLMVGPPPTADAEKNGRLATLSAGFAEVCRELDVPYLDVLGPLEASGTWVREAAAGDGSHPGAAGYAELACLVRGWAAWAAWLR